MNDQERRIFRYWNGGQPVNADPVTIRRRLTIEMGGSPNLALRDWYAESPAGASEEDKGRILLGVAHAEERLVAAARVAFALPPFVPETGAGAMDQDAIDALEAFVQFEAEQKKSGATPPTSPAPTAPPSSPNPSPPSASTDSGSMPSGSDSSGLFPPPAE